MDLKYDKFSAIIPAYNEAKTISHVITEVLKTKHLGELIVVDDGSSDDTQEALNIFKDDNRFLYIRHEKNKGKGGALKTGLKKAKNEVILFLDADLKNITAAKILKIVLPVLKDDVDLSRARFSRRLGRVTEIAAKPMMRILFPDHQFDQPITGQICGKKEFFKSVDFDAKWGVDIGILLDAIDSGQRIQEVNIGKLEHRHHTDSELAVMAEQVLETMIKKAGLIQHKYKMIIFTLDQTLISKDSIPFVLRKLGLHRNITILTDQLESGRITYPEYLLAAAREFKGKSQSEIDEACDKIELTPYASEVLRALKQRKFAVAIVSPSLSPIVSSIARRFGITNLASVDLEQTADGILTGEITKQAKQYWLSRDIDSAMVEATRRVSRKVDVKPSEAVIVASTSRAQPIFNMVGLSLAYRTKSLEVRRTADKTIQVLAEILALVE